MKFKDRVKEGDFGDTPDISEYPYVAYLSEEDYIKLLPYSYLYKDVTIKDSSYICEKLGSSYRTSYDRLVGPFTIIKYDVAGLFAKSLPSGKIIIYDTEIMDNKGRNYIVNFGINIEI